MSLQSIEDKTSVPGTTLRRIMSLKGNPNPENVIKIFRSLGFDQGLYKYHPEIAMVMNSKEGHNSEYEYIDENDREYFVSEDYYLLVNLAFTSQGTTEKEISYVLGQKGIERMQELLNKGILEKNIKGKIIGKLENYKLGLSDTKKRVEQSLRHYRLEEAGGTNNWISFQTESLNLAGLKALKQLQQKHFYERKEQIFKNSAYIGDFKIYSASVSSTFLSYNEQGNF
jgi:hypothetical protein